MAVVMAAYPTEASADICRQSGCGHYHIDYVYEDGHTATVAYVSQYEWMSDSNGVHGQWNWTEHHYAAPYCDQRISDESLAWARYLQDVADVAGGHVTGAGLESPAGNKVGHIC